MATYLLTWNPDKWYWEDIQDCVEEVADKGILHSTWSCGLSKKIVKGDRIFMLRQGVEPKGIFGSGYAESSYKEKRHWNPKKAKQGRKARYIKLSWEVLLNPDKESILPREWL